MENKPKFQSDYVVRCRLCGILSSDFITCDGCVKKILPGSEVLLDPFKGFGNTLTPDQVKRRKCYGPLPLKEEPVVIDLTSDEENDIPKECPEKKV